MPEDTDEMQTIYQYAVPSSLDTELAAIAVMVQVLASLPPAEQQRAIRYLDARFGARDAL